MTKSKSFAHMSIQIPTLTSQVTNPDISWTKSLFPKGTKALHAMPISALSARRNRILLPMGGGGHGRGDGHGASTILRTSAHTFLQNYHYFTSVAALLAFPFSLSFLLAQAFIWPSSMPSSTPVLIPRLRNRFEALCEAAGFPVSLEFFVILGRKLPETIFSSIFTLPFSITFLLAAKASIIRYIARVRANTSLHPLHFHPLSTTYASLLQTNICSFLIIISANATAFFLLFFGFSFLEAFQLSSLDHPLLVSVASAVIYSLITANAFVICNLALVLSGAENVGGSVAIVKACSMIRGRSMTALSLAVVGNFTLAAMEALFKYRVIKGYRARGSFSIGSSLEGCYIAYLYSVVIVFDTVVTYIFFESCQVKGEPNCQDEFHCWIQLLDNTEGPHLTPKKSSERALNLQDR